MQTYVAKINVEQPDTCYQKIWWVAFRFVKIIKDEAVKNQTADDILKE